MAETSTPGVAAAAQRAGNYRWVICGLLFAATAINYVDRQMLGVLKGTLHDEIGWTEISYSNIVACFQLAYAFGYLGFGPLADRFGRRPVFAFMCLGSLIMLPVTYLVPSSYIGVLMLLPILGFFNNGIFSGFPIYLPELYPTQLRATGAGFCFNAGRVLASASPLLTGWLVTTLGSFSRAASTIALIYLLGLIVLLCAPETKGRRLPD